MKRDGIKEKETKAGLKISRVFLEQLIIFLLGTYLVHRFGYAFFLKKALDTDLCSAFYGISYWLEQGCDIVEAYYPSLFGAYLLEGICIYLIHKRKTEGRQIRK